MNDSINTKIVKIKEALSSIPIVSDAIVLPLNNEGLKYRAYISIKELFVDNIIDNKVISDIRIRDKFKKNNRNVEKDLKPILKLADNKHPQLLQRLKTRKSYRNFINKPIELSIIEDCLNAITKNPDISGAGRLSGISTDELAQLLSYLRGYLINADMHYKYLYPSAGGLYPVQVYIIPCKDDKEVNDNNIYYFNPHHNTICSLNNAKSLDDCDNSYLILFIANSNAIKPLYGEISRKYCEIECGHMLSLLHEAATIMNINVNTVNMDYTKIAHHFSQSHVFINCVFINTQNNKQEKLLELSSKDMYVYSAEQLYQYKNNQLQDCAWRSPYPLQLNHQGDNHKVIKNAAFLILFVGETTPHHLSFGFTAQNIITSAFKYNIGFCPIGIFPIDKTMLSKLGGKVTYCLAGGYIADAEILNLSYSSPEADILSIADHIKALTAKLLPHDIQLEQLYVTSI